MGRSDEPADRGQHRVPVKWAAVAAALIASASAAGWTQAQELQPAAKADAAPSVVLEADQVTSDNDQIVAEGHVEARYQGRVLRADKVIYDTNKQTVHAAGRVEILDVDGSVRFADEIEVDNELNAGVATGFSSRIPGGGMLAASSVVRRPNQVNELNRVVYTACPVCKDGRSPAWTLRARKAVQDPNTQMISYRDVVLQVHNVPVLWLPYFSHPDPSAGRKSGFLLPDIGQSRRLGGFYRQPYYWAISDYSDLTVAAQAMTNVNPLLFFKYRKEFWSGDLQIEGSGTYEQNFDNNGNRFGDETMRSHVFASGKFRIDDYWKWQFGVARASDDLYLRRYDIPESNSQTGLYLSDLTRLFSHVDLTGQDENSYSNLSFMSVQGLRDGDNELNLPLVLPVGEYDRILRDPWLDGRLKLQASTANLVRSDAGPSSARLTGTADWSVEKIIGPGLVLTPFAQGRGDVYRIDNYTTTEPITVSRALGIAGAELRWPLVRAARNGVSYMIEPIAMAAVGSSGANDPRIPNEDAQSFELDDLDLFRPNGVPNYDLWEPGPRVSLGMRASAVGALGTASAEFGRRWRSESDPAFAPVTNLDGKASDWVGAVSADLGANFGGTLRLRMDEDTFKVNRVDTSLHAKAGPVSGSVRYFDIEKSLVGALPAQEIAGTIAYDLNKKWNFSYGLRRDLDSAINLSQNAGVIYRDDCSFVEFVYTHTETLDRSVGPSEGFQIRIGLTTLGVFGGG